METSARRSRLPMSDPAPGVRAITPESAIMMPELAITMPGIGDHHPGTGDQDELESVITFDRNTRSQSAGIRSNGR